MRILVITNRYAPDVEGGYEETCKDVVEALIRAGHEVCVLSRRSRLEGHISSVARILPDCSVPPGALGLLVGLARVFKARRKVARLAKAFDPDLVYLWNLAGLPLPLVTRWINSRPTVVYVAEHWFAGWITGKRLPDPVGHKLLEATRRQLFSWKRLARIMNRMAKWAWVPYWKRSVITSPELIQYDSRYMRQRAESEGILIRSTEVPHGIHIASYDFRPTSERSLDQLLYVGRVVADKGIETIIESLSQFREIGRPETCLTVVGHGEGRYVATLIDLADRLGVLDRVRFRGRVPRENVPQVFSEHGIFVFAPVWEEPFGIVLLEALASGIPTVCSGKGGTSEIIHHESTGLIFKPGDSLTLSQAILRFQEDADLADRCSRAGRALVENQFDVEVISSQAVTEVEIVAGPSTR